MFEYYSRVKSSTNINVNSNTNDKAVDRSQVNTEDTRGIVNMAAMSSALGTY